MKRWRAPALPYISYSFTSLFANLPSILYLPLKFVPFPYLSYIPLTFPFYFPSLSLLWFPIFIFPLNLPHSLSIFPFPSQPSPSILFLFPTYLLPYWSTSLPTFSFTLLHPLFLLISSSLLPHFLFLFPSPFLFPSLFSSPPLPPWPRGRGERIFVFKATRK